jgi:hypothetical protein
MVRSTVIDGAADAEGTEDGTVDGRNEGTLTEG